MDFDIAVLTLRLVVGTLFVGHGMQKLAGWFGGSGIDGTAKVMDHLEMRPGRVNAIAAGLMEAGGGLLLASGFLTPLAAAMLVATMIVAVRTVHFANGIWNTEKGYEYNLVLVAVALATVAAGPGAISLDNALGLDLAGLGWAGAALLAGIVGSTAAIEAGKRAPAQGRRGVRGGGHPSSA
jgi:putative oxidoreductase